MNAYQVVKILKARKAMERELELMANTPRIDQAIKRARTGKGRGDDVKAVQSSIRLVESLDKLLYDVVRIKNLPKPKYPGRKRV